MDATRTFPRPSGTCPSSCGSRPPSSTGSSGSSTSTTCSSCPAPAWAADRTSTPTRCTSHRSSSSTRRSGRASPTGPTSWRPTSTRRHGCSAWSATRTCRPTSIACMQQVAIEMGRGETFNKAPVGVYFGSPGVEAEDPYFGGVGPRRTGCISCGKCNIGCGHNAKNKLTTNYLYLAEQARRRGPRAARGVRPRPARRGRVRGARASPGLGAASRPSPPPHLHRRAGDRRRARVRLGEAAAAHAAQGPPDGAFEPARPAGSDELRAAARHHPHATASGSDDPDRIRLTPGSVSITSGVWPDSETSIEPVYWGVGNDLFAFLVTYHQHGEQKHPTAAWIKELIEHPTEVLSFDDARHWAERTVIMLCSQTTDTSIELYWHDGRLRSRHAGTPPSVHIPIVEKFVDRMAANDGRPRGRAAVRGHQPHRLGPLHRRYPDRRQPATPAPSTPTSGSSASRASTSSTAASCRPTPV